MSAINQIQIEIILYIRNMDREVKFYRDVMVLPIRYPKNLKDYSSQMWVEFEVGDAILALHGGAEGSPKSDHELVFMVDDLAEARRKIIESGIPMGEIRPLEDGAHISEGRDPDGHRFSIRS